MRRHVTTLIVMVLTIFAGSQLVNGQPQQQSSIPAKLVAGAPSTSDLMGEIATMLRAYYDGWTKLDAAAVSAVVADDGFVTTEGKLLTGSVFKSSLRGLHRDFTPRQLPARN